MDSPPLHFMAVTMDRTCRNMQVYYILSDSSDGVIHDFMGFHINVKHHINYRLEKWPLGIRIK